MGVGAAAVGCGCPGRWEPAGRSRGRRPAPLAGQRQRGGFVVGAALAVKSWGEESGEGRVLRRTMPSARVGNVTAKPVQLVDPM